jgi:hypothetical protein
MPRLTDAMLKAELDGDPAGMGYAPFIAENNDAGVRELLHDRTRGFTRIAPVAWRTVVTWGAQHGIRAKIQDAADTPSNPVRDLALTFLDSIRGLGTPTLDLTDPVVVGATAGGAAYIPGGDPVATPGMLDALVAAGVLVDGQGASLKDDLIELGRVPVSRLELISELGTTVTNTDLSRVLRGTT